MAGPVVSVVLHLLFFFFAWHTQLEVRPTDEYPTVVAVRGGERYEMRVERIVPVPDAEAGVEDPVEPEREEPEPVVETQPGPGVEDAPAAVDPWADVPPEQRLRPRMGDPRLWTRPETPELPEPSDLERARARIADRITEWNDSMAAEGARAASALDWTHEDAEGKKWGVSPGKLHLGDLTLPLPINFSPPPWQRDEAGKRARQDGEIRGQEAQSRSRENLKERVEAIRERKDKERSEKKKNNGSGTDGGTN